MSLQYFDGKKYLFIKLPFFLFSFNLFISILCAKILCVTWASVKNYFIASTSLSYREAGLPTLRRHGENLRLTGFTKQIRKYKKRKQIETT